MHRIDYAATLQQAMRDGYTKLTTIIDFASGHTWEIKYDLSIDPYVIDDIAEQLSRQGHIRLVFHT